MADQNTPGVPGWKEPAPGSSLTPGSTPDRPAGGYGGPKVHEAKVSSTGKTHIHPEYETAGDPWWDSWHPVGQQHLDGRGRDVTVSTHERYGLGKDGRGGSTVDRTLGRRMADTARNAGARASSKASDAADAVRDALGTREGRRDTARNAGAAMGLGAAVLAKSLALNVGDLTDQAFGGMRKLLRAMMSPNPMSAAGSLLCDAVTAAADNADDVLEVQRRYGLGSADPSSLEGTLVGRIVTAEQRAVRSGTEEATRRISEALGALGKEDVSDLTASELEMFQNSMMPEFEKALQAEADYRSGRPTDRAGRLEHARNKALLDAYGRLNERIDAAAKDNRTAANEMRARLAHEERYKNQVNSNLRKQARAEAEERARDEYDALPLAGKVARQARGGRGTALDEMGIAWDRAHRSAQKRNLETLRDRLAAGLEGNSPPEGEVIPGVPFGKESLDQVESALEEIGRRERSEEAAAREASLRRRKEDAGNRAGEGWEDIEARMLGRSPDLDAFGVAGGPVTARMLKELNTRLDGMDPSDAAYAPLKAAQAAYRDRRVVDGLVKGLDRLGELPESELVKFGNGVTAATLEEDRRAVLEAYGERRGAAPLGGDAAPDEEAERDFLEMVRGMYEKYDISGPRKVRDRDAERKEYDALPLAGKVARHMQGRNTKLGSDGVAVTKASMTRQRDNLNALADLMEREMADPGFEPGATVAPGIEISQDNIAAMRELAGDIDARLESGRRRASADERRRILEEKRDGGGRSPMQRILDTANVGHSRKNMDRFGVGTGPKNTPETRYQIGMELARLENMARRDPSVLDSPEYRELKAGEAAFSDQDMLRHTVTQLNRLATLPEESLAARGISREEILEGIGRAEELYAANREAAPLYTGEGEWSDYASGIALPDEALQNEFRGHLEDMIGRYGLKPYATAPPEDGEGDAQPLVPPVPPGGGGGGGRDDDGDDGDDDGDDDDYYGFNDRDYQWDEFTLTGGDDQYSGDWADADRSAEYSRIVEEAGDGDVTTSGGEMPAPTLPYTVNRRPGSAAEVRDMMESLGRKYGVSGEGDFRDYAETLLERAIMADDKADVRNLFRGVNYLASLGGGGAEATARLPVRPEVPPLAAPSAPTPPPSGPVYGNVPDYDGSWRTVPTRSKGKGNSEEGTLNRVLGQEVRSDRNGEYRVPDRGNLRVSPRALERMVASDPAKLAEYVENYRFQDRTGLSAVDLRISRDTRDMEHRLNRMGYDTSGLDAYEIHGAMYNAAERAGDTEAMALAVRTANALDVRNAYGRVQSVRAAVESDEAGRAYAPYSYRSEVPAKVPERPGAGTVGGSDMDRLIGALNRLADAGGVPAGGPREDGGAVPAPVPADAPETAGVPETAEVPEVRTSDEEYRLGVLGVETEERLRGFFEDHGMDISKVIPGTGGVADLDDMIRYADKWVKAIDDKDERARIRKEYNAVVGPYRDVRDGKARITEEGYTTYSERGGMGKKSYVVKKLRDDYMQEQADRAPAKAKARELEYEVPAEAPGWLNTAGLSEESRNRALHLIGQLRAVGYDEDDIERTVSDGVAEAALRELGVDPDRAIQSNEKRTQRLNRLNQSRGFRIPKTEQWKSLPRNRGEEDLTDDEMWELSQKVYGLNDRLAKERSEFAKRVYADAVVNMEVSNGRSERDARIMVGRMTDSELKAEVKKHDNVYKAATFEIRRKTDELNNIQSRFRKETAAEILGRRAGAPAETPAGVPETVEAPAFDPKTLPKDKRKAYGAMMKLLDREGIPVPSDASYEGVYDALRSKGYISDLRAIEDRNGVGSGDTAEVPQTPAETPSPAPVGEVAEDVPAEPAKKPGRKAGAGKKRAARDDDGNGDTAGPGVPEGMEEIYRGMLDAAGRNMLDGYEDLPFDDLRALLNRNGLQGELRALKERFGDF